MSLLTENVIPGNYGRIFTTNANTDILMDKIKMGLEHIDGVEMVLPIEEVSPREFIVRTSKLVTVHTIEEAVQKLGLDLHVIPKGIFPMLEK